MKKTYGPTWQPSPSDHLQVIREQNPWHETRLVPDVWAQKVERPLANALWDRLVTNEPRRFQLVLGPRRVGKSTCLYQTVRHLLHNGIAGDRIWWLRLDHPLLMQVPIDKLLRGLIKGASPANPSYIFFDELAYAKEWDLWLKTFYDEHWPVVIAGSSSSTAAIRHRHLESGIGRWEEQYLAPYLFGEYLDLIGKPVPIATQPRLAETIDHAILNKTDTARLADHRRRFLLTGGFPELLIATSSQPAATDEESVLLQSQRTLRNDAIERAIYKDIPQAFGVDNPMMLERLLYILAGQIAGLLSANNICRWLDGLSQPTFDRYLRYLKRSFLVFTLPNYSGSEVSVQKRGRKLYFNDGAVRNAALQRGLAPLTDTHEMGLLTENLVASHLHALGQQAQIRIFFWRDGDNEVDLIYDDPVMPVAFEIASSITHTRHGLHSLVQRHPKFAGRTYLVAPNALPMVPSYAADHIGTLPLDLFLLCLSAQAEQSLQERLSPAIYRDRPSLFS